MKLNRCQKLLSKHGIKMAAVSILLKEKAEAHPSRNAMIGAARAARQNRAWV